MIQDIKFDLSLPYFTKLQNQATNFGQGNNLIKNGADYRRVLILLQIRFQGLKLDRQLTTIYKHGR